MKLEVLLSVMNLNNKNYLSEMNINSDVIVVNQSKKWNYKEYKYNNKKIREISANEKGVGLSRNTALMRSNGDVVQFADEDMIFVDNYEDIILEEYNKNIKADIILFNVKSLNEKRPTYNIKNNKRVHLYECLRYGAVMISGKRNRMLEKNLSFSLLFGGGARFSSGEDSLFLYEAIKKGLKVYAVNKTIGYVKQEDSTWFKGYNDNFFIDKGAFFYVLSPMFCKVIALYFILKNHHKIKSSYSFFKEYLLILDGIKKMREGNLYEENNYSE